MSRVDSHADDRGLEFIKTGFSRALGITTLVVMLLSSGLLMLDWVLRPGTWPVHQVSFRGEFQHVTRTELEQAILSHVHQNYLALDMQAMRRAVEALPWVHQATVRRRWPAGLEVSFAEQQLAGRWNERDWLNRQGEVVRVRLTDEAGPAPVPELSGPDGSNARVYAQYRQLLPLLKQYGLDITSLSLSERHSWVMTSSSGIKLMLGRTGIDSRLKRFLRVYQQSLQGSGRAIARADLRYTNGFAVQWAAQAVSSKQPDSDTGRVSGKG